MVTTGYHDSDRSNWRRNKYRGGRIATAYTWVSWTAARPRSRCPMLANSSAQAMQQPHRRRSTKHARSNSKDGHIASSESWPDTTTYLPAFPRGPRTRQRKFYTIITRAQAEWWCLDRERGRRRSLRPAGSGLDEEGSSISRSFVRSFGRCEEENRFVTRSRAVPIPRALALEWRSGNSPRAATSGVDLSRTPSERSRKPSIGRQQNVWLKDIFRLNY